MKICTRCVLPDTFPGIRFDADGTCNYCRRYTEEVDQTAQKQKVHAAFLELAEKVRSKSGYHCALAFSGGKDSTYTLWLLRNHYGLRVLAVTFDNGFISPQAFRNISTTSKAVGAESIIVRPPRDVLVRLFASVLSSNPYPSKTLERASAICNGCIGIAKNIMLRTALERRIPMIVFGWSPGQAPISAALFRMNGAMLRQMHHARTDPLTKIAGKELEPYLLNESHLQCDEFPYNVNLLAFHEYSGSDIVARIQSIGWTAPTDTDGNSTNCLLNGFTTRAHIAQHGFHPYAFEIAGLVRGRTMTREQGLAALADLGNASLAEELASQFGYAGPPLSSDSAET